MRPPPPLNLSPLSRSAPVCQRIIVGSQPSIEDAMDQPSCAYEMPHDVLVALAATGDREACEERMIRHIMAVDQVRAPPAAGRPEGPNKGVVART